MSNKYVTRVWTNSPSVGTDRLVLLCIADRANASGLAWPGIADIANRARISKRSAQRAIQSLEKLGELRVNRGAGRTTSRYWVLTRDLIELPMPEQSGISEVTNCPTGGDITVSPLPGHQCHPSGDIAVSPKPIYNPQSIHNKQTRARGVKGTPLPDNFGISADIQVWATTKGIGQLTAHLEAFKLKALSKGYLFVDWDSAFQRALLEDWAELRKVAASNVSATISGIATTKRCAHCCKELTGGHTSMRIGNVCNSCYRAYTHGEWNPGDDAQRVAESLNKRKPGN